MEDVVKERKLVTWKMYKITKTVMERKKGKKGKDGICGCYYHRVYMIIGDVFPFKCDLFVS